MSVPPADPAPVSDSPPSAPPAMPPADAAPATRWARMAAMFIDVALVLLLPGLSYLVLQKPLTSLAPSRFGEGLRSPFAEAVLLLAIPFVFELVQLGLVSRLGRTVGQTIVGIRWRRAETPGAPGFVRALVQWLIPLLVGVGAVSLAMPPVQGIWIRAVILLLILAMLLVDAGALVFTGRSVRERIAGVRAVSDGDGERAFAPPRFSGIGFAVTVLGWLASLGLAGALWFALSQLKFESTDLDLPTVLAGASLPLFFVATGALAAYFARRFVVGELALVALLAGLLAFEAMALKVLPVPAMQKYEIAGWLDWTVYSLGTYFGSIVFLIIGSALGFMVSSDDGVDASTRFERLVARRHLRLKFSHWLQLAVIATLAPILIYGVFIWPVRAVWRLMKGHRGPKPQPPTVFMALLTIVGVMFGVTSLTVVLAVMGGFERDLKEKILGTNAHGIVHRYTGDFSEWHEVEQKVKAVPGVAGVTPFIMSEVMITTDSAVAGSVLKGIDVETVGQVTDLEKNIDVENGSLQNLVYPDRIPRRAKHAPSDEDTTPDNMKPPDDEGKKALDEALKPDDELLPGIVIGREMARSLHVWIGDRVTVMNPLGELGPSGPVPRSRTFRVAAIFVSGMYEYDSKFAYITLREAQRFFRMGDAVTGLELRFTNVDEARPIMRRIINVLGGFPYTGKDWGEMNRNLFSALRLERVVMFILLSFQVLIACICVIATLVMLVVEKRKEVATLKAMGAREGSIMKLFVIEGLIIGAIGTFYGSAAGYLFCKLIEKFGVGLDPEVYYITRLPVVIEPTAFLSVAAVAMVLVFVATIYPARRGGSIAPVEGFREE